MNGFVSITKSKEKHANCNCCESVEKTPPLWDVRFTFRNHTTLIKLCSYHLNELKNQIDENF